MRSRVRITIGVATATIAILASTTAAIGHPTNDGSSKESGFDRVAEPVSPGGVPQERMSDIKCKGKAAGIFGCERVDLASFHPAERAGRQHLGQRRLGLDRPPDRA